MKDKNPYGERITKRDRKSTPQLSGKQRAAWALEIEQRVAAFDRGEVKTYPAEDVFAEARLLSR